VMNSAAIYVCMYVCIDPSPEPVNQSSQPIDPLPSTPGVDPMLTNPSTTHAAAPNQRPCATQPFCDFESSILLQCSNIFAKVLSHFCDFVNHSRDFAPSCAKVLSHFVILSVILDFLLSHFVAMLVILLQCLFIL
jgi:hypothetical protein